MDYFAMDDDLRRMVQNTVKQMANSFQPRPKRGRRQRRPAASNGSTPGDDFPIVRIVNASGATRAKGSVFGYGTSADPPPRLGKIPTFNSAAPAPGKPFVVALADISSNDVGECGPVGVVDVQVNVTSASHEYAEAIANDYTKLTSAATGAARILWRAAAGLGVQWAQVRLDPIAAIDDPWGVVYQTITAASGVVGGPITPGHGLVTLYLPPTGPIGTPWQPGPNIACETSMPATSTVPKVVIIRKSRVAADGSVIYRAIAQSCADLPSG